MKADKLITVLMNSPQYWQRIKSLFGSSLVAYWPMNEGAGSIVYDRSINGHNGVYGGTTGVTLAQPAPEKGGRAALFPGANAFANVYSSGLATAFPGREGSFLLWVKTSAAMLVDGETRNLVTFHGGLNDYSWLYSITTDNTIQFLYNAASAAVAINIFPCVSDNWVLLGCSWSDSENRIRVFRNGRQFLADTAMNSTWGGTLAADGTVLGARNITPIRVLDGSMAHVVLLNREVTESEHRNIFELAFGDVTKITFLGDSISTGLIQGQWPYYLDAIYNSGKNILNLRAVAGSGIISGMAAQVTDAASDNANTIIIALGTNDDNAGNMTTLQATYEAGIAALKVSNPNATIYAMNVLPRWTDAGGGTPVDKSNIRTAIAAACTAQSITCWDTFTTPWIDAGDTSDGTHPTAAGHIKIATQVLARL